MGWGDELMAAGEVSLIYDGEPVAILGSAKGSPRTHDAWKHNPQVQKPNLSYRASIVNGPGTRPYVLSCDGKHWKWKQYKPTPAPMFFSQAEYDFAAAIPAGFIALEPSCKQKEEAVNRDWGWQKWVDLAAMLKGHRIVQLASNNSAVLPGVELISTPTPRYLAVALTRARAFVSTEGGFHHTAASAGLPGVVIYGHFNSPMVTGYDFHRHIYSGGLGCGSRIKCSECRAFMDALQPKTVYDQLMQVLDQDTKGHNHG